ncbi:MAG: mechanosensitive ion channel family protein [Bacteroidota bacterium]
MELLNIYNYLSEDTVHQIIRVLLIIVITIPVLLLIRGWARRFFTKKYAPHYGMLAGKVVFYTGIILMIITVMGQMGISLAPLLAGAGIVGVALGFASQTSVSNIISGLFLIAEQPFKVDDIINVGGTMGYVMSIDVLSIKLRTFDNMFVRIPNETIIKTEVTNLTRFPIRRFNAKVSVAYKEDIEQVREILLDVAEKNQYSLSEPAPQIIFEAFGASSIDLDFRIWAPVDEWILLKNSIQEEVKKRFDEEGIEIPFPHVSFYTGSESKPLPIELVKRAEQLGTEAN